MEYRRLGRSGLKVSALSSGSWVTFGDQIDTDRAAECMLADDLDCTTAQLALGWCLQNDDVSTVITGASKPHQVAENMEALEVADRMDADVPSRIESILDNEPDPPPNFRHQ